MGHYDRDRSCCQKCCSCLCTLLLIIGLTSFVLAVGWLAYRVEIVRETVNKNAEILQSHREYFSHFVELENSNSDRVNKEFATLTAKIVQLEMKIAEITEKKIPPLGDVTEDTDEGIETSTAFDPEFIS